MRLPFLSSSESRGEGGGVAFWVRHLFCGESSTRGPRLPSLGPAPGGSAADRNTPTPCAWDAENRVGFILKDMPLKKHIVAVI